MRARERERGREPKRGRERGPCACACSCASAHASARLERELVRTMWGELDVCARLSVRLRLRALGHMEMYAPDAGLAAEDTRARNVLNQWSGEVLSSSASNTIGYFALDKVPDPLADKEDE
eukprot:6194562-Pleurochrysis_carterae.AAC.1